MAYGRDSGRIRTLNGPLVLPYGLASEYSGSAVIQLVPHLMRLPMSRIILIALPLGFFIALWSFHVLSPQRIIQPQDLENAVDTSQGPVEMDPVLISEPE